MLVFITFLLSQLHHGMWQVGGSSPVQRNRRSHNDTVYKLGTRHSRLPHYIDAIKEFLNTMCLIVS